MDCTRYHCTDTTNILMYERPFLLESVSVCWSYHSRLFNSACYHLAGYQATTNGTFQVEEFTLAQVMKHGFISINQDQRNNPWSYSTQSWWWWIIQNSTICRQRFVNIVLKHDSVPSDLTRACQCDTTGKWKYETREFLWTVFFEHDPLQILRFLF